MVAGKHKKKRREVCSRNRAQARGFVFIGPFLVSPNIRDAGIVPRTLDNSTTPSRS